MKGNRKKQVNRETQLALLLGFGLAVWMKADSQLFIALGLFLVGAGASFMWGNVQEHRAEILKPAATTEPPK